MFRNWFPNTMIRMLALVAGVGLLAGCGGPGEPLGTEPAAGGMENERPGSFTLALTPGGLQPAAKWAGRGGRVYSRTTKGLFTVEEGGRLGVRFGEYAGDGQVQVLGAAFEAAEGAINRRALIAMTVFSGTRLRDIWVRFSPSHVVKFVPEGTLTLVLKGDLPEELLRKLVAYHLEGSCESVVSISSSRDGRLWKLSLKVPGFSRYSLGGNDDFAPEASTEYAW